MDKQNDKIISLQVVAFEKPNGERIPVDWPAELFTEEGERITTIGVNECG